MTRKSLSSKIGRTFLGIDGGATHCVALLVDDAGRILRRVEAGPANVRLLTDAQLVERLRFFAGSLPTPDAIGVGLAGAWESSDTRRIQKVVTQVWPGVPARATTDLEVAMRAAKMPPSTEIEDSAAQVLIVSGTGSCAYGQNKRGAELKIGGWGHVLGDCGSAYQIGLHALRVTVETADRTGHWPELGGGLLRALQLNEPAALISWAQAASKVDIAALAVEVFRAAAHGDKLARGVVASNLKSLAEIALVCADRLAKRPERVQFFLSGGVLMKQPGFARQLARLIKKQRPTSMISPLGCESVWGAVAVARELLEAAPILAGPSEVAPTQPSVGVRSTQMSPTERRNPRSMRLDTMSVAGAVDLMLNEEGGVARKLLAHSKSIEQAVTAVARAFQRGGRLFYVGAGTSGRLGVLDASECPVTFRTAPEMVQGIIAGGQPAMFRPVEGAEDDVLAGRGVIATRAVRKRDVVLGIAASGTTPFVWGAIGEAKRRGATTILLCFNPYLEIPRRLRPHVVIAVDLGPEVLTGSTRLKAGTATKVVLNVISTLAMVRIGKVVSNLMVDVIPSNIKLRDRALRIVIELTGCDREQAQAALKRSGWVIKKAVASLGRKRASRATRIRRADTTRK